MAGKALPFEQMHRLASDVSDVQTGLDQSGRHHLCGTHPRPGYHRQGTEKFQDTTWMFEHPTAPGKAVLGRKSESHSQTGGGAWRMPRFVPSSRDFFGLVFERWHGSTPSR